MESSALHQFFEYAILPQFGISNQKIEWKIDERIGYDDDDAHYFNIDHGNYADEHVLIFRDYGDFSSYEVIQKIRLPRQSFTYIDPLHDQGYKEKFPHTFVFMPDVTFLYVPNVTGYFTLIRVD